MPDDVKHEDVDNVRHYTHKEAYVFIQILNCFVPGVHACHMKVRSTNVGSENFRKIVCQYTLWPKVAFNYVYHRHVKELLTGEAYAPV